MSNVASLELCKAASPEDCVAMMAIELIKQGIIQPREGLK